MAAIGAVSPFARAQVFHDEAVNGDLSDNRLAPTAYTLPAGTGSLLATTGAPALEYLALTIPSGMKRSGGVHRSAGGGWGTFTEPQVRSGPMLCPLSYGRSGQEKTRDTGHATNREGSFTAASPAGQRTGVPG